jgi:hypothetical protein
VGPVVLAMVWDLIVTPAILIFTHIVNTTKA